MQAHSFQNHHVTYHVVTEDDVTSNEFHVDAQSGVVELVRMLDFERDDNRFRLKVKAVENGRIRRTSTVSVSQGCVMTPLTTVTSSFVFVLVGGESSG